MLIIMAKLICIIVGECIACFRPARQTARLSIYGQTVYCDNVLHCTLVGEDVKTVVGLEYTAYTVREGSMADDPALGLWVCVALQSGRLVERFTGTLTALPNTALGIMLS